MGRGQQGGEIPPEIKKLLDELVKLKDDGTSKYHMDRAAILEKICKVLTGNPNQETWMRQLIDAYGSATELGDKTSFEQLTAWKNQVEKYAPKTPLAGFATFRHLSVEYFVRLKEASTPQKAGEVQKWWREELEKFVTAYPNIDETPEAALPPRHGHGVQRQSRRAGGHRMVHESRQKLSRSIRSRPRPPEPSTGSPATASLSPSSAAWT